MKKTTLSLIGLLASSSAFAQEATPQEIMLPKDPFSFCDWAQSRTKLFDAERDNAVNPYIQEFNVSLRMQYQWTSIDPAGGDDRLKKARRRDNQEWRRFRAGVNFKLFNAIKIVNVWNLGGMEGRDEASGKNGQEWTSKDNEYSLYELYAEYKTSPITYTLGKMKPAYLGEYRTSSSAIVTIERSSLVNQLRSETNWGIQAKNSNKDDKFGWQGGVYMNGNGNSSSHKGNDRVEPAFNSYDNCFIGLGLNYDTSNNVFLKKSRIYLDWTHNFTEWTDSGKLANKGDYNGDIKSRYQGTGAKDVVGITWDGSQGKFSMMTELMAGFNTINTGTKSENVVGLSIIPTYKFTPKWEGVFRYQVAAGSNAVLAKGRYLDKNTNYAGVADKLNAFYLGVNYYFFDCNPNMAKIMLGVEYTNYSNGEVRNAKDKPFTGWEYTCAFRTNF